MLPAVAPVVGQEWSGGRERSVMLGQLAAVAMFVAAH